MAKQHYLKPNHGNKENQKDKYKTIVPKWKGRISGWVKKEFEAFYTEHDRIPDEVELAVITERVNIKLENAGYWIDPGDFSMVMKKKLQKYAEQKERAKIIQQTPRKQKTPEQRKAAARRRQARANRRKRMEEEAVFDSWQDDNFFYIAGYTSGGAPFGVTWDEKGLEPWQEPEEETDETCFEEL